ncbi:MAG: hypothetical protein ABWY22_01660 [Flavobacterium sp.]
MKNYSFWLKTAAVLQLITGCLHSLSLFANPQPANATEEQLFDLMDTYHLDFGSGFTPTMGNLMTSFSVSLSLFLFFAGILNLFLIQSNLPVEIMKGVIRINFLFFGLCLLTMIFLTFLIPIICLVLIFLALIIATCTFPKNHIIVEID